MLISWFTNSIVSQLSQREVAGAKGRGRERRKGEGWGEIVFYTATSMSQAEPTSLTTKRRKNEIHRSDQIQCWVLPSYRHPFAAPPSGIFLPGTELLQSPFRTEFSMGSRSRRHRRFLRSCRRFLRSCRRSLRRCRDRRAPMRRRRSLRDWINIIKHC